MDQFGKWHNSHTMGELLRKPVCAFSFQNKTESPTVLQEDISQVRKDLIPLRETIPEVVLHQRKQLHSSHGLIKKNRCSSRCICFCSPDSTVMALSKNMKMINHMIGNGAILLLYMCFDKQYPQTYRASLWHLLALAYLI